VQTDVLLVTATHVETVAVLGASRVATGAGYVLRYAAVETYYDLGTLEGVRLCLVQSELGAGGAGGSILTVARGIQDLSPSAVLMVGIAFGMDEEKQELGQVLVGQYVRDYEVQKIGTSARAVPTITARGVRAEASIRLLKMARAAVHDWTGRVDFGPLLSGGKLINNRRYRDALLKVEPEALGGEMEGAGVYAAAQAEHKDWIVIKAICDWADGHKDQNKKERQEQAARNAAAFVFHLLGKGGFRRPSEPADPALPPHPPVGAADIGVVEAELRHHTDTAVRAVRLLIPGLSGSLAREEVGRIEDQLRQPTPVLLTGDPGSGKSGIAATLARRAIDAGAVVLFLDARRVAYAKSGADLRHYLSLHDPVATALARVAQGGRPVRLIIDHLDSCIDLTAARLLVGMARDCSDAGGVEVVVVSRNKEAHEIKLLDTLVGAGFVEITSFPLSSDRAEQVLVQLGIAQPQPELIVLAQNLMSLELIGTIKQQRADFDFSAVLDDVDLWEHYLGVLEREEPSAVCETIDEFIAKASRLAAVSLAHPERAVTLGIPPSRTERRLVSWQIVLPGRGRTYRFRHDQLQEYLYARDAVEQALMPSAVIGQIGLHRAHRVLPWMEKVYERQDTTLHGEFLGELFHV